MPNINLLRTILEKQESNPERRELSSLVKSYWDNLSAKVENFMSRRATDIEQGQSLSIEYEESGYSNSELASRASSLYWNIVHALKREVPEIKIFFDTPIGNLTNHLPLDSIARGFYNPTGAPHDGAGLVNKQTQLLFERLGNHVLVYVRKPYPLEAMNRLGRIEAEQLEYAMEQCLGADFKAVYMCPAYAPSTFSFRGKGKWTYVDKTELNSPKNHAEIEREFFHINSNSKFVVFDLTNPQLPTDLPENSFDLVFYNQGYEAGDAAHLVASKICQQRGIVLTRAYHHDQINQVAPNLLLLGRYPSISMNVYVKN